VFFLAMDFLRLGKGTVILPIPMIVVSVL